MESKILFLQDWTINVVIDKALLFFIVRGEPNISIRIRWMEGLD